MRLRVVGPVAPLLLVLAACAGGGREASLDAGRDAFFQAETVAAAPAVDRTLPPGATADYVVGVILRRAGSPPLDVSAPRVALVADRPAGVLLAREISYVRSMRILSIPDARVAEPTIGMVREGLAIDLAARPVSRPDRARLAWRLFLSDVRSPIPTRALGRSPGFEDALIQYPAIDVAEVEGVREVPLGRLVRLARLPDPSGGRPLDVLVRVESVSAVAPDPGRGSMFLVNDPGSPDRLAGLLRGTGSAAGRLVLEAVLLADALPVGVPVIGGAVETFEAHVSDRLRRFEVETAATKGAAIRGLLRETCVRGYSRATPAEASAVTREGAPTPLILTPILEDTVSGLAVEFPEDGEIELTWTFTPERTRLETDLEPGLTVALDRSRSQVHSWRGPLPAGRCLVPLARLSGGGTAAVFVSFESP